MYPPFEVLISNHSKRGIACHNARRFLATVLRESKTRAQWHLFGCYMQLICADENEYNTLCITLNHNAYEGEKLFSLYTDHELSQGESNPKLPRAFSDTWVSHSVHSPCITRNSKFHRVAHEQVTITRKHRT